MRKIRWGLMGAGAILDRWMKGAAQYDDMEIVAISSRTRESSVRQAEKFGISEICTFEELVSRDDIDVVYVNSVHTAHAKLAMMAMNAGKSVLVEKPGAINEKQFQEMIDCAKKNNVFLMEAVWTRFFPIFNELKDFLDKGGIGDIRLIQSIYSFKGPDSVKSRLFDINRAGGSLLDVGVYTLHFSDIIMRKTPVVLKGVCAINTDSNCFGVDESCSFIASYSTGELASMSCGIRADMPEIAYIYGSNGYIEIPSFYKPDKYIVHKKDELEVISSPIPQNTLDFTDEGYQFEIRHVNDCIRCNLKESPIMTHSKSIEILRQCDLLRNEWNIIYPDEI